MKSHACIRHRHAMHARVFFCCWMGKLRWDNLCLMFSLLLKKRAWLSRERKYCITLPWQKRLTKKLSSLSEINSPAGILWSFVSAVWILLSKDKLRWCHAYRILLRSQGLVLYCHTRPLFPPWTRECITWRDLTTIAKETTLTADRLRWNKNYSLTVAFKMSFHVILLGKAN